MHISILHNSDHQLLEEDPGREAREDVTRVAAALAHALTEGATLAEPLAVGQDPVEFLSALQARRPALVINLCESLGADARGEMAIPCLLDLMGIPYTGSSALPLGLALHKHKAKELLRARGVPTPEFHVIERLGDLSDVQLPFPVIVKPAREDASVGIELDSVVHDRSALRDVVTRVLNTFHQPALVERFITGREIYVPLLGNSPRQALPMSEISFGPAFERQPNIVSYRAKWAPESEEFRDSPSVRCTLPAELEEKLLHAAVGAFEALDCRDYGRVDFRLSPDGEPYVIDINPNCDLHPDAGFAKAALAAGFDYRMLALRLVDIALERTYGNPPHPVARPGGARRAPGASRNLLTGRDPLRPGSHRPRVEAK